MPCCVYKRQSLFFGDFNISFTFLLCCFKSLSDFWRQQSIVYFGGARKVQYQKTDIFKIDTGISETGVQTYPGLPLYPSKDGVQTLVSMIVRLGLDLGLNSRNFAYSVISTVSYPVNKIYYL